MGQSSTLNQTVTYSSFLTALTASASSAADAMAIASLPPGATTDPVTANANITSTTADLRALGLSGFVTSQGTPDSTITLNTSLMNLSRTGPQDPNKYDIVSTVEHEIDEALGLGSHIDGSTAGQPATGPVKPEDLFRYSASNTRSYTNDPTATSYFSVDGGVTNLTNFNQAGPPGGSDYGDWASSAAPQVQDAFGSPGTMEDFGPNEQTALDVIGSIFAPTAVPEPSSWLLLAGGLGLAGYRLRRRHSVTASIDGS